MPDSVNVGLITKYVDNIIRIYYSVKQVKNLVTINPSDQVPVKNVTIRCIPR